VRNQDQFGQPVNLNIDGEDAYKTIPGGCISLVSLVIVFLYFVLKLKYMINHEEWGLT